VSITPADTYSAAYPRLQKAASQHARRLLRDRGEADDVVQDALMRAYIAWDDVAGFAEPWVARVAINLAIGRLRRKPLPLLVAERGQAPVLPTDTRIDVTRAVDGLPRRQREVIVLRYVADLALQEVADLLDISTGSVKRHLHRALTALRHPAAGLTGTYSTTTSEEDVMTETKFDWRTRFTPAVEPAEGWPPGPWDHRWFDAGEEGRVQRLACDNRTGQPILDAEGDEVRAIKDGADLALVKVTETLTNSFWAPVPDPPLDRLDAESLAVLDHAQRLAEVFGMSYGFGLDDVAMALLDLVPEAERVLGCDTYGFRRRLAGFRDGPFAEERLVLVEQRLAERWTPPPLDGATPVRMTADLSAYLTEAVRRIDFFGSFLPEEESTLKVRPIDLLHLIADPPAPHCSFIAFLLKDDGS